MSEGTLRVYVNGQGTVCAVRTFDGTDLPYSVRDADDLLDELEGGEPDDR